MIEVFVFMAAVGYLLVMMLTAIWLPRETHLESILYGVAWPVVLLLVFLFWLTNKISGANDG